MSYGNYGGGGGRGGSYGGRSGGNRGGGGRRQEFDPTNKGAFWEIDNRDKKNDKSPDLNGKINIDGVDHWISGWYQREGGGQKPVIRFALGDPCEDSSGRRQNRRDDYDRSRRDDGDDRRGGGQRDNRNDRDDNRGGGQSRERYDQRRERDEDDRRERNDSDRRRSNESQRPFPDSRDDERGGDRGGAQGSGRGDGRHRDEGHDHNRDSSHLQGEGRNARDDDDGRYRDGPNSRDGGPEPEGPKAFDEELGDVIPF